MLRVMLMTGRSSSPPGDVIPSLPGLPPAPCPGHCPGVTSPPSPPFYAPKHPPQTPSALPAALPVTSTQPGEGNTLASCIPSGIYHPGDFLRCLSSLSPLPVCFGALLPHFLIYFYFYFCRRLSRSLGQDFRGGAGDSGRARKSPELTVKGTLGLVSTGNSWGKEGRENPANA